MVNKESFKLIIYYVPAVQFSIIATFSGKTYLRKNSACRNKKRILKAGLNTHRGLIILQKLWVNLDLGMVCFFLISFTEIMDQETFSF